MSQTAQPYHGPCRSGDHFGGTCGLDATEYVTIAEPDGPTHLVRMCTKCADWAQATRRDFISREPLRTPGSAA